MESRTYTTRFIANRYVNGANHTGFHCRVIRQHKTACNKQSIMKSPSGQWRKETAALTSWPQWWCWWQKRRVDCGCMFIVRRYALWERTSIRNINVTAGRITLWSQSPRWWASCNHDLLLHITTRIRTTVSVRRFNQEQLNVIYAVHVRLFVTKGELGDWGERED